MSGNRNHWGRPVTSPLDAIRSGRMSTPLRDGMARIFAEFLMPDVVTSELTQQVWDVSRDADMSGFDKRLQNLLVGRLNKTKIRQLLDERARHVARQIVQYLEGKSLLDVGTGDGMVAACIQSHFTEHLLTDVMDYRDPRVNLPFVVVPEGQRLPVRNAGYDTVVLTNVLHHAADPTFLLNECVRAARARLVVIESVYGDPSRLGQSTIPFSLSPQEQFVYTSFFDWFYNRVLHSDVPVPFNFLSPPEWRTIFGQRSLREANYLDLGIDVEIVPIHHVLYVLDKDVARSSLNHGQC